MTVDVCAIFPVEVTIPLRRRPFGSVYEMGDAVGKAEVEAMAEEEKGDEVMDDRQEHGEGLDSC